MRLKEHVDAFAVAIETRCVQLLPSLTVHGSLFAALYIARKCVGKENNPQFTSHLAGAPIVHKTYNTGLEIALFLLRSLGANRYWRQRSAKGTIALPRDLILQGGLMLIVWRPQILPLFSPFHLLPDVLYLILPHLSMFFSQHLSKDRRPFPFS